MWSVNWLKITAKNVIGNNNTHLKGLGIFICRVLRYKN